MHRHMKKIFFLVIPLLAVFLLAPSAFAKKKKHCRDRYRDSYYDRPYYDRPNYDRGRYSRYDDRYYDDDDYYRRRTPRRQPRYDDYYGGSSYPYPAPGYYGGSSYPPVGNIPWWDILLPRY